MMEKVYLEMTRKTSFIAEIRELEDARKHLREFLIEAGRQITISDILRFCITNFNDDPVFRNKILNSFRKKSVRENEESTIGKVFS